MGEEWGSKAPFPFFCDFEGDLAEAVRQGRRKEFAGAYAKYGAEVPDPLEPSTAKSAALDWDSRDGPSGRRRLALVRELLAIRREKIVPRLAGAAFGEAHAADSGLLIANWRMGDGATLHLVANLSKDAAPRPQTEPAGLSIWGGEIAGPLSPWSVFWRLDSRS
ncbi:MAG: DUF3459 domain-containing protein, partial [Bradyrhizobium sp.]|nr:DUF3459 domain-containing protein [Bradyrhizobium sp.]